MPLSGMKIMRRFVRYSTPEGEERLKGCCCLPGKWAGVLRLKLIRGEEVKRVCSLKRGV